MRAASTYGYTSYMANFESFTAEELAIIDKVVPIICFDIFLIFRLFSTSMNICISLFYRFLLV